MKEYPTPFHLYDEAGIRKNAQALKDAFAWNKGFREYFAVKATPNPFVMNILREYGCGYDCSSLTELMLSEATGVQPRDIMFSSNDTPGRRILHMRISSVPSLIWMTLLILTVWRRLLAIFRRLSAVDTIRVDCLRFPMILWIIREMPNTV